MYIFSWYYHQETNSFLNLANIHIIVFITSFSPHVYILCHIYFFQYRHTCIPLPPNKFKTLKSGSIESHPSCVSRDWRVFSWTWAWNEFYTSKPQVWSKHNKQQKGLEYNTLGSRLETMTVAGVARAADHGGVWQLFCDPLTEKRQKKGKGL